WVPISAQSPGVYPVTVEVTDDGVPSQFARADFEITVSESPNLALRRVWQIGTDDDPGVEPYLPNGEFSPENGRNDPQPGEVTRRPGDPGYVPGGNPPADDDFYFAGLYPAGFNQLVADRTVTSDEPPVAWESAHTGLDRTNRVHFVLEPGHVAPDATFQLIVEFPRGGASVAGVVIPEFGTHPLEFRFRNSLGAEAMLGSALIPGPTNIVLNFPASAAGATVGANTLEIVRTDVLPPGKSAWILYDFLRLESFPPGSAPPVITQRPKGANLTFGETVVLSVKADSATPPTFQWFRNKRPIPGATGPSYLIPSVGVGDIGDYFVVVTNPNGSASS
ncbi:MAG: immunoglobulin domain-containing protein, partial [Desulfobacterales bacterium]|nr:immunoglobulin domain-containing protein [Desulfobacterales bacterium]